MMRLRNIEYRYKCIICISGELVDDIDVPDAISFIAQPQTVANNIAIATGYVSTFFSS
jgi:hypothetical protein